MRVIFCGLKYEYGKETAGLSFEYQNLFESLQDMENVEAIFFPTDAGLDMSKRDRLNSDLISLVNEQKPDLLFCFLFTDELKKETIQYITQKTNTKTFNWFADDHWRFHIYSKFWAPLFTAVSTTDSKSLENYKRNKINNVIHSQWAVNPKLFFPKKQSDNKVYEITFVGQNYSTREQYINYLQQAGLPVVAYGTGWGGGRILKEQTGVIWSNSKINLNFTEGNYDNWKLYFKLTAKIFLKKEFGKYKLNILQAHNNIRSILNTRQKQIKSRNFEIPACRGFLITGDADNLKDYYTDGKEIVIFHDKKDLLIKCKYYLEHPKEREEIAEAGYQKTILHHTYKNRFLEIFKYLDLC